MALKTRDKIYLPDIVGKGYASFWKCRQRYRIVKGSRGSKKSKTTALWYIYNMMKYPGANTLVVRRTGRTLKDSCYADLLWAIDRLKVTGLWKGTVNPLELTYLPTGQKILFRGLDDGLKITSIAVPQGVLCWVWCEEFYEITKEDDFNKLDMSIRGQMPPGLFKQITGTFNPWSANSWLKSRFFDKANDNTFTLTTTYRCNEWLDDSDRAIFEDMQKHNPRRFAIEGNGEWGISEGLIYEKVEYADFDIDELRRKEGIKAAFGLDFGFTDPTAFICMLLDKGNKKIYVFNEWYKRGTTNTEIAAKIIQMGYGSQRITCDAAEPKSIKELKDNGVRNAEPSRKGGDSVNHGIQQLQNYTIVVHTSCKEFYREISNYCWALDKFDRPTDSPEHEFSHGMDAMRYGITKVLLPERFSFE